MAFAEENNKDISYVQFYITSTKYSISKSQLMQRPEIQKVLEILKRNKINTWYVDNVPGSYNLDQEWIETDTIRAKIDWEKVTPFDWNNVDAEALTAMQYGGEINIVVNIYDKDGNWIAENH